MIHEPQDDILTPREMYTSHITTTTTTIATMTVTVHLVSQLEQCVLYGPVQVMVAKVEEGYDDGERVIQKVIQ